MQQSFPDFSTLFDYFYIMCRSSSSLAPQKGKRFETLVLWRGRIIIPDSIRFRLKRICENLEMSPPTHCAISISFILPYIRFKVPFCRYCLKKPLLELLDTPWMTAPETYETCYLKRFTLLRQLGLCKYWLLPGLWDCPVASTDAFP